MYCLRRSIPSSLHFRFHMRTRFTDFAALALVAASISLVPASASAQIPVHGIASLGLEYGGDKLGEFQYEDGSTPDVTAGGGLLLTLGGGAQLARFGRNALDAQLSAGLKWRTIPAATNQDANWLRIPVEGLLFFRAPAGIRSTCPRISAASSAGRRRKPWR